VPAFAQQPVQIAPQATASAAIIPAPNAAIKFKNTVTVRVIASDGTVKAERVVHNLVTNAGLDYIKALIGNAAGTTCPYIAVTNDSASASAADTVLASEITTNGVNNGGTTRYAGTYSSTGTGTFTLVKSFTLTGTVSAQKTGLFTATSAGTMCAEANFSAVTGNSGDTLQVTWSWAIS
jgi:hypothetical protein